MLRKYFSIFLLTLVVAGCGGGSSVTPVEIEVTLNSSAETIQYNDTYTLSWASNASQCYASGGWTGEKPTTGTETFTAKTRGPIGYGIECRKNNVFTQAQAVVTLEKDFINSFDFKDEDIVELLTIEHSDGARHKVSSHFVGDFNNDGSQDMLIAYRVDDPRDIAEELHPRFFQILGGTELIATEIVVDGCSSGEMFATGDFNLDGIQDLVALPTKTIQTISGDVVDSKMCFFQGSDTGLDITNWNSTDYIDNSTSIDLNNFAVTSVDPVDISGDGYIVLLFWANVCYGYLAGLPFYIVSNTESNPFVQLSTEFIDLDPYLPSTGCAQDIEFLCSWKNFYGTSQIYFNDDITVDLIGSACEEDLSSCSYTNFLERFEEGNDFKWSISATDVLTPSVNSGESYSRKISINDNNSDGYFDLVLLENDTKFSVYERAPEGMSAQDNGDFQSLLSSTLKFSNDWLILDLDLDNDFDLLAPIDCVQQTCTNKMFNIYQKSSFDTDVSSSAGDVTFTAADGSPIITVNQVAHGSRFSELVTFSGAESLGGAITAEILNGQFTITSTPTDDTYTIESSVAANADDVGNGGEAVVGTYIETTYIWTEEDVSSKINFLSQTINTLWLDSNGDNDIDAISVSESRSVVAGTNIPISSTYKIYHHKNDSLR